MMNRIHNDPEADVEIDYAYRGDIRCAKLSVTANGSIVGNVEAVDVRNRGRIHGVLNASDIFINCEGARFRGSLFSPQIGNHPKARLEGSTSHTQRYETDSQIAPLAPSAINMAVQEGLRRELGRLGFASDNQRFAIAPNTTFARPDEDAQDISPQPRAPTVFRTPDGALHPVPDPVKTVDFAWAPPVPSQAVWREGREYFEVAEAGFDTAPVEPAKAPAPRPAPRALPALFATGK